MRLCAVYNLILQIRNLTLQERIQGIYFPSAMRFGTPECPIFHQISEPMRHYQGACTATGSHIAPPDGLQTGSRIKS